MATVAVYNCKGGVGKTTLSLSIALQAIAQSYKVLIWEIDSQGDMSWLLGSDNPGSRINFSPVMNGRIDPLDNIQRTHIPYLSLLPGDPETRNMDNFFVAVARRQKLSRLFAQLEEKYDLVILDCPPGFSKTNQKIMMLVNAVLVPIVPSPLARRGLERIRKFITNKRGSHAPILPVLNMVDRRRKLHKASLQDNPDWPVIPMASGIEQLAVTSSPESESSYTDIAKDSLEALWIGLKDKLQKMRVLRNSCHEMMPY